MAISSPITIVAMWIKKSFQVWTARWGAWTSSTDDEVCSVEGDSATWGTATFNSLEGRTMSDDILSRLHKELEGTTANSPAVCEGLSEGAAGSAR